MATTTKSARLTAEEVTFLQALLLHFPEYRSESHLLHNATMVGLWILAVSARRPGLPPFGGYEAEDLAALIGPRMMVAIDFLAEQGRLPALLRISEALAAGALPVVPPLAQPSSGDQAFDAEVADEMADLGTDFME